MANFTIDSGNADLLTSMQTLKNNILSNICCVKIGMIEEYNYETRVSRVKIMNKLVVDLKENGDHILQDYPPLYCKTLFLGGSTCGINWDIRVGDECIVFFNDREIETLWLSGQVSDLKYHRTHDFTDAICLTGFRSLPKTTPTNNNINIHSKYKATNIESDVAINSDYTNIKASTDITLDAPVVNVTGNLNVATGYTGIVPCGLATLTISNGIITGVS